MAAPKGNQNAARGAQWRHALIRALRRAGGEESPFDGIEPTPEMKALDEIADKVIEAAKEGPSHEKGDPWLGTVGLLGDRLDGKPAQQVQLSGDADSPLVVQTIRFTDADDPASK